MATSRSMPEFNRRMFVISQVVGNNARIAIKRAAVVGSQVTTTQTPVRTGNARFNWRASVGAPDTTVQQYTGSPAAAAQIAQNRNESAINTARGGLPIFLSNGVEYIAPLDRGSSAQAPNGMTSAAIQAMGVEIRKVRLLRGV